MKNNHKLCSISHSPGLKSDILHGNYLPYWQQPSASTHIFCSQRAYQRTQRKPLYHIYRDKSTICRNCICKFLMNDNFILTIYAVPLLRGRYFSEIPANQLPKIYFSAVRTVSPTDLELTTSRALSGRSVMILSTPRAIIFCISLWRSTVQTKIRFPL